MHIQWTLFRLLVLIWMLFSIPLRVWFFSESYGAVPSWIIGLDYLGDGAIGINLFFSVMNHQSPRSRLYLYLDFIAMWPMDLIGYTAGYKGNFGILRLSKLALLVEFEQFWKQIAASTWKTRVQVRRLALLFTALTISCHWVACIWEFIAQNQVEKYTWQTHDPHYSLYRSSSLFKYIRAMYWSCITMTTVGFGEIVPVTIPETLFTLVVVYLGMIFSCASIANITTMMYDADQADISFQQRLDDVSACLEWRGVNDQIQHKVLSYMRYADQIQRYDHNTETINEILHQLPNALRQRIQRERQQELFHAIPIFSRASQALCAALSEKVERKAYAPGDVIVREGNPLDGLYYIRHGVAHSFIRQLRVGQLSQGDYIGDASLFLDAKQDVSVVCVTAASFCEILWLPQIAFQDCLVAYQGHKEVRAFIRSSRVELDRRSSLHSILDCSTQNMDTNKYHPDSNFRHIWTMVCFVGLLYNFFSIPRDLACGFNAGIELSDLISLVLSYLVDVVFIADIFFKLNRFSFMKDGVIITNQSAIRREYIFSLPFYLDLVAALPLDLIAVPIGLEYLPLLRLTKVARLVHLYEYFQVMETILVESYQVTVYKRRLFKSMLVLFLSGYVAGSIFVLIGTVTTPNWIQADRNNPNFAFQPQCWVSFTRGIYFAYIGTSTLGFGDIVPVNVYETIYTTLLILYGAIMKPAVVGGIASMLLHCNLAWKEHSRRVSQFNLLVKAKGLPAELQDRVNRYYDYAWSNKCLEKEAGILRQLPRNLRAELAASIWNDMLIKFALFRTASDQVLTDLYAAMEPKLYLPEDKILTPGMKVPAFHILTKGIARVLCPHSQTVLTTIHQDDVVSSRCFGYEVFLSENSVYPCNIIAQTYCEFAILPQKALARILANEPELATQLDQRSTKITQVRQQQLDKHRESMTQEGGNDPINRRLTSLATLFQFRHRECPSGYGRIGDKMATSAAHPESAFRFSWDLTVLMALVYNLVAIPFRIAFFSTSIPLPYLLSFLVDYAFDFILAMDIYLRMSYFFYIDGGRLVTEAHEIRSRQYHSCLFWMDIFSSIPIDIVGLVFVNDLLYAAVLMALCRTVKLLKLVHFSRLMTSIERRLADWKPQFRDLVVIGRVLLYILLTAHCFGCLWFLIARLENQSLLWSTECLELNNEHPHIELRNLTEQASCLYSQTWIEMQIAGNYLPATGGSMMKKYLRSIYFTLQMVVIVISGDVSPVNIGETFFCIFVIFSGVIVSAAMIGLIAEYVLHLDTRSSKFRQLTDALMRWMSLYYIPKRLRERAAIFMEHIWNSTGFVVSEEEVVMHLPRMFRHQIVRHTKLELIEACPLFSNCRKEVIDAIADAMERRVYAPGDVVTYRGQLNHRMFFFQPNMADALDRSSIGTISNTNLSFRTSLIIAHSPGTYFGDRSLLLDEPQQDTLCAAGFTQVYILRARKMEEKVYNRFPQDHLREKLIQQLQDPQEHTEDGGSCEKQQEIFRPDPDPTELTSLKDPFSRYRYSWDVVLLLMTLYLMILVPLRVAFLQEDSIGWYFVDYLAQIIYLIDIYLNLKYFNVIHDAQFICDPTELRELYRPRLILDILSICPFSLVAWILNDIHLLKYLLLPQLLRIFRFGFYLRNVAKHWERGGQALTGSVRVVLRCILYFALAAHWCACIWMGLHRYVERHQVRTWATEDPFLGGQKLSVFDPTSESHNICFSLSTCYLRAYYFVFIFISTVGYGDVRPNGSLEYVFQMFQSLLGAFLFASLIGSFTAYFRYSHRYGSSSTEAKAAELGLYFKHSVMTKETQQLVERTAKLLWHKQHGLQQDRLMKKLPVPLQMEISEYVKHTVLRACPFLCSRDWFLQSRIALSLQYQVSCANQPIISAGDLLCEVLFIHSGRVQLVAENCNRNRPMYGELGDHFGRATRGVCQDTVRAVEQCDFYVLDEAALKDIMEHIPKSMRFPFLEELDETSLHARVEAQMLRIPLAFDQEPTATTFTELNDESGEESDYRSVQSPMFSDYIRM